MGNYFDKFQKIILGMLDKINYSSAKNIKVVFEISRILRENCWDNIDNHNQTLMGKVVTLVGCIYTKINRNNDIFYTRVGHDAILADLAQTHPSLYNH